jgi:hypothetical protein
MRPVILAWLLVGFSTACSAQCGGFSETDRISDVKGKLDCWAQENAKLAAERNVLLASAPDFSIHFSSYAVESMSRDKCKSRALTALLHRGAAIVDQGDFWIAGTIGALRLQVSCTNPSASYVAATARKLEQGVKDGIDVIVRKTFVDP